jgi:hypothetical protein
MSDEATTSAAPAALTDAAVDAALGPTDAQLIEAYNAKKASPPDGAPPPAPPASPAATATPEPVVQPDARDLSLDHRIREYVDAHARETMSNVEAKRAQDALRAERDSLRAEMERLRKALREDPLAVTAAEGWDFEALARKAVGSGTPESVEVKRVRSETDALRAELAQMRQEQVAAQNERDRQAWRSSIQPTLSAQPEAFKHVLALMDAQELQDATESVVRRVYEGSGGVRVLSIQEAAALLESQAKQRIERIRPLVTAAAPPSPTTTPAASVPGPSTPRGLTNTVTQAAPVDFDPADLSDAALNARALAFARSKGI